MYFKEELIHSLLINCFIEISNGIHTYNSILITGAVLACVLTCYPHVN